MNCCANCFQSHHEYLMHFILRQGSLGACDYCGSTNVHCLAADALRPVFEPVLALCEPATPCATPPSSDLLFREPLYELIDSVFRVWGDDLPQDRRIALLRDIAGPGNNRQQADHCAEYGGSLHLHSLRLELAGSRAAHCRGAHLAGVLSARCFSRRRISGSVTRRRRSSLTTSTWPGSSRISGIRV